MTGATAALGSALDEANDGGNPVSGEPENLVLQLLRDMRGDISSMRSDMARLESKMATKEELAELRADLKSDIHSLRADVASDLMTLEKRLSDQILGLRRSVRSIIPPRSAMAC